MDRVMVSVYLPAAGREFDVRLPVDINVGKAAEMVARALEELSQGTYKATSGSFLAWRNDSGEALNIQKTLRQCGVKNTSKLMMI